MMGKKNHNNERRSKAQLWIAGIVAGVILGLIALWFLARNTTLYSVDKQQITLQVQSALDTADFRGSLAFASLDDIGCDNGHSVGLAYDAHCDLLGQKYFKGNGELGVYLREADEKLMTSGWQRDSESDVYDKVFSGASSSQLQYKRDGNFLTLVFYEDSSWNSSYDIRKLLEDGKIPPLENGEFVYGVRDSVAYWSCRWDSFFKQPCPAPPSKGQ